MHPFESALLDGLREAVADQLRNNKNDREDRFETSAITIFMRSGHAHSFAVGENGVQEINVCQCEDLTKVVIDLGDTRKVFEGTFDVELTGQKVESSLSARRKKQATGKESSSN